MELIIASLENLRKLNDRIPYSQIQYYALEPCSYKNNNRYQTII